MATVVTLPLLLIALLLLGNLLPSSGGARGSGAGGSDAALPAITAAAPPHAAAETTPCTALLADLPLRLATLAQRRVVTTPESPFVVAWGDPAVVLRCGVDRPAGLVPGSDRQLFPGGNLSGAWYWVDSDGSANVYTAIDRTAYVSLTLPLTYQGADYLPIVNDAILKAMPKAVCSTDPAEPDPDKLCTRRTD